MVQVFRRLLLTLLLLGSATPTLMGTAQADDGVPIIKKTGG